MHTYLKSHFNSHTLLSHLFSGSEISAFRSLQACTGTLIAGPAALNFFDRTQRVSDPLDIFVYFQHRSLVAHWLSASGYLFIPSIGQFGDLDLAITVGVAGARRDSAAGTCAVLVFEKASEDPLDTVRTIRMFVASQSPIAVILNAGFSTY